MQRYCEIFCNYIEKIREYFNNSQHRKNCLWILILYAVSRLIAIAPVSKSGDAFFKWRLLRIWTESGTYPTLAPDHHQGRWMLNLPVRLFMEIFGSSNWVYYIYPLLCGLICAVCVYFIAARLKDKFAGMMAVGLFLLFPLTTEESIQFLPMVPASAFIMLAMLCMFRYHDTRQLRWPLFSGILLAMAYGCKVTSVYWFVPFTLYLVWVDQQQEDGAWSWQMRFPAALWLFLLGGAAVAAAELCYLNAFFGVKFGRVSMLMSGHFKDRPDPQYLSTLEYLGSFLRPLSCDGKYFHTIPRIMLLLAAIYSGILLWRAPGRKKPLTLAVGCFFAVYLLHCYVVYKFFPFLHPERPNARYLLALIILGIALYTAAWELRSEHLKKYFREYTPLVQFLFNGILLVVMLIALINPLPKGENLLQLVNQNILLNNVSNTPVLQQLKLRNRQLTKSDIKYAQMYMCTFAPLSELHPSNQRGWLDVSGKQDFYTDENGRIYRYLWGGKPAENTPLTAIVCYGSKCRRTQLVLKRAKKP